MRTKPYLWELTVQWGRDYLSIITAGIKRGASTVLGLSVCRVQFS